MAADDTVTAKLAEWETLTNAATEGPWESSTANRRRSAWVRAAGGHMVDHYIRPGDAEFIAAARTAMPALLGFVREVRALHVREPYADEPSEGFCRNCQRGGAAGTWPCPTEQAAQKWIGGEG